MNAECDAALQFSIFFVVDNYVEFLSLYFCLLVSSMLENVSLSGQNRMNFSFICTIIKYMNQVNQHQNVCVRVKLWQQYGLKNGILYYYYKFFFACVVCVFLFSVHVLKVAVWQKIGIRKLITSQKYNIPKKKRAHRYLYFSTILLLLYYHMKNNNIIKSVLEMKLFDNTVKIGWYTKN